MGSRRQEKMARLVKEAVSDAIANHLNDPRIEGFVSVTRVSMAADLRSADVYLSHFASRRLPGQPGRKQAEGRSDKTFIAITHARRRIQSFVADKLQSKFCPVLHFHMDDQLKETLETTRLMDQIGDELRRKDAAVEEGDI
jgi:ribosome-binding factor A